MSKNDLPAVFRMVVDSLHWPVTVSNLQGKFLYANSAYGQLRKRALDDVIGNHWWDITSGREEANYERERLNRITSQQKFISIVRYATGKDHDITLKWESRVLSIPGSKKRYIIENGRVISGIRSAEDDVRPHTGGSRKNVIDGFRSLVDSLANMAEILGDRFTLEKLETTLTSKPEEWEDSGSGIQRGGGGPDAEKSRRMIRLDHLLGDIEEFLVEHYQKLIRVNIDRRLSNCGFFGNYYQIYEALVRLGIILCQEEVGTGMIAIDARLHLVKGDRRIQGILVKKGNYAEIKIDTGTKGNLPKVSNDIFEPFKTAVANNSENHGVYDLVMPLIYNTIKKHRGYIFVEQDKGRYFRVLFPVVLNLKGARRPTSKDVPTESTRKAPISVLLVDHDQNSILYLKSLINALGYTVFAATGYQEALEKYFKAGIKPGLMVIDPFIPLPDGHQLIRKLKELNPDLKIIVLSDYSSREIAERLGEIQL